MEAKGEAVHHISSRSSYWVPLCRYRCRWTCCTQAVHCLAHREAWWTVNRCVPRPQARQGHLYFATMDSGAMTSSAIARIMSACAVIVKNGDGLAGQEGREGTSTWSIWTPTRSTFLPSSYSPLFTSTQSSCLLVPPTSLLLLMILRLASFVKAWTTTCVLAGSERG